MSNLNGTPDTDSPDMSGTQERNTFTVLAEHLPSNISEGQVIRCVVLEKDGPVVHLEIQSDSNPTLSSDSLDSDNDDSNTENVDSMSKNDLKNYLQQEAMTHTLDTQVK